MSESADSGFFRGSERLEFFPQIGRLIRKGDAAALQTSDADCVRQALRHRKGEVASDYLTIVRANSEGMVIFYTEMNLALAEVVDRIAPDAGGRQVVTHALERWKAAQVTHPEFRAQPESALAQRTFTAQTLTAATLHEFRRTLVAGHPILLPLLLQGPAAMFESLSQCVAREDFEAAASHFEQYYRTMRVLHDLLVELSGTLIASIAELHGSAAAQESVYRAITGCLFYEGLWQAVSGMKAEEVAAFLADHLRGHFSGTAREGTVEVIEEPDRYRLIFAPCGSGGAMRQRALRGLPYTAIPLTGSSPQTWSRERQVPGYCSHCAMNELESMRRLGYPVLVTEFDPDPHSPCGWTVYKSPDLIPDSYFDRIGIRKDPAKFNRAVRTD